MLELLDAQGNLTTVRARTLLPLVTQRDRSKNLSVPDLPMPPLDVLDAALADLDVCLELTEIAGPTTHVALAAIDVANDLVPRALGRYLVGVVAGAVDNDAALSEELLAAAPDEQAEVRAHVIKMIGEDNNFGSDAARHFRDHVRNPWIAEVLAHALLVLRRRRATLCLLGDVQALKLPHIDPRRQGLDLIAIFEDGGSPALAIGEAKASRENGAALLNDAVAFFKAIDSGARGVEIRQEVHALKHVLSDELRQQISDSVWRERCCYLPVIVHSVAINPGVDHVGLSELKPVPTSKRLLALRIDGFYDFFDAVSDAARGSFAELLPDV